jgi:hypothetical protein
MKAITGSGSEEQKDGQICMHEVDEYCKLVGEAYLFHRNISSFRHKEE